MNQHPTTRRSFLGSIAILSAGAAFGTAAKTFALPGTINDPQNQWNAFCRQNKAQHAGGVSHLSGTPVPVPGSHLAKEGEVVCFAEEQLLAQPTWIYWGSGSNRPADLVITFYQNNQSTTKLFRLNRFELEALLALPEDQNHLALLKQAAKAQFSRQGNNPFCTTVKIQKNKKALIQTRVAQNDTTIQQQLFYHI